MKRKRWVALTLAGILALGSCSEPKAELAPAPSPSPTVAPEKEGEQGGEFALPCDPEAGFHPITGTNRLNLTLAPLIYQGLFSVGENFQAEKDLCESYTVSPDGRTWTFRIGAAEFSDGTALTVREVASSLELARSSGRYAGRLADVESIGTEGETVVVSLRRPNRGLPALLDIPIIKEGEDPQRPLGTGAYALNGTQELALVAREGAQVPLPVIRLRAVKGGDDLIYAFDAREIFLVDTDLTGTNALGYSGRLETIDYPTTTLLYVGCNLRAGFCQEQKIRQAIARLLDREEIVERYLAGHAVAAPLPVHPALPGYDLSLSNQWQRDPDRARSLLEEAGWMADEEGRLFRRREPLELRMVVNQDNTFKTAVAEAVVKALESEGFRVTLDRLAWEDFVTALEKKEFDLYLGETTLTADFDLEPLLGREGALNYMGFADGECWEWMDLYRGAEGKERETTLVNICGRVAEQSPIVPICFKNGSLLTQWGQVSGMRPTQRNVFSGFENWSFRHS